MLAILLALGLMSTIPYTYHAPATLVEYTESSDDVDCTQAQDTETRAGCQAGQP